MIMCLIYFWTACENKSRIKKRVLSQCQQWSNLSILPTGSWRRGFHIPLWPLKSLQQNEHKGAFKFRFQRVEGLGTAFPSCLPSLIMSLLHHQWDSSVVTTCLQQSPWAKMFTPKVHHWSLKLKIYGAQGGYGCWLGPWCRYSSHKPCYWGARAWGRWEKIHEWAKWSLCPPQVCAKPFPTSSAHSPWGSLGSSTAVLGPRLPRPARPTSSVAELHLAVPSPLKCEMGKLSGCCCKK